SFTRISSVFDLRRKHPILSRIRAHRGVDYAAPIGTPIKSAGDGTVVHIGARGGYGRTIVLRHSGDYRTLYAHMSRYAAGLRWGSRVSQGQIIGFVGSSGLANGPHLHYEFQVNGAHRNPLTVPLPRAPAISEQHRPHFESHSASLLARLDEGAAPPEEILAMDSGSVNPAVVH
ncbi:MAG: M23 family metallopeptidase, partial [Gammaproteobacteria bacterium]